MAIDRVRHGRQIRLLEIGVAGQERLAAMEVVLGGTGDAREVEAAYVARAGMRITPRATEDASLGANVTQAEALVAEALASLGICDENARAVADGALRALLAIREVLGIERAGGGE